MNPGPVEEAGKAAGFFMTIMKDQPLSLALVLMNVALLILFWLIMDRVSDTRQREMKLIYEEHKEVRELLARCVIPQGRTQLQSDESQIVPLPRARPQEETPP